YDGSVLKGTATAAPYNYAWAITSSLNGTHSWTSRAYDAANNVATSTAVSLTVSISVPNTPPTANAGADQTALSLASLTFNGSSSADPDGPIASYAWNFGDGATATGAVVSHSFSRAGSYTVSLTVTDGAGATGSDTAIATITNRPPVANAGADQ